MAGTKIICLVVLFVLTQQALSLNSAWRWVCTNNTCQKKLITESDTDTALSLAACRLFCHEYASLWPKPTGEFTVGDYLAKINVNSVDVLGVAFGVPSYPLLTGAVKIFRDYILNINKGVPSPTVGRSLVVTLNIANHQINRLSLTTDESYNLTVSEGTDGRITSVIDADNFFAARHGLETLTQLIVHDDLRDEVLIFRDIRITDKPAYPWRGVHLDTARNYISVDAIKRTLTAMGASKLNRFHWHITDSHSFPWVSSSLPELSKLGAYSPSKVYNAKDVADIIQFGLERGVAVVPEFDAPAHVGEGWQNTGLTVCFNHQPWTEKCVEPPCGQFDPTQDKLYETLEVLYGDLLAQFNPDVFHMGGDEVNLNCWNTTTSIVDWMAKQGWGREADDFHKLWNYFQSKAFSLVNNNKTETKIPIILWTSTLTDQKYLQYLPKEDYIIQIWETGTDPQIPALLDNGYRLILSNYDALYLDCGFGGWVQGGNNWCSPYIGWQKVYSNTIASIGGDRKDLFLGSTSILWTEQVDSESVDSRLWPRASATAEVLWSEPTTPWRDAEQRFLVQRERLVKIGVAADSLEPEWCLQNEEQCPIGDADDADKPGSARANRSYSFLLLGIVLMKLFQ